MQVSEKYWKMCQISLTHERKGYEYRFLPLAQECIQSQLFDLPTQEDIQKALLSHFHNQQPATAPSNRAKAGLCLRCSVSYPILKACQKIGSLYSSNGYFTYRDLLPLVLTDDGKDLIILGSDGKGHLKLDSDGNAQPVTFKLLTVEILRSFKSDSPSSMSLDNWAFLQTKQYPELKNFLSEFGFQHLSDWALLNRVRVQQLEQLTPRDRRLVEAFHAVYRRDRRQQKQVGRCPAPDDSQLVEMANLLQQYSLSLKADELTDALKHIAKQLRQFDVWHSIKPLGSYNEETGLYDRQIDIPSDSSDAFDAEEQEFLDFLRQQLEIIFAKAIEEAIQAHLRYLRKSKRYAPFASCFIPGLQLYYGEGLSLKDIGPQLGMSSRDQSRRILNPGELLSNVRRLTVQQLLKPILEKAQSKGLASKPPEPTYLKALTEQIEAYVDTSIFEEAVSEIKAGKNRSMDSVYAQHLKQYVTHHP